MNTTPRKKPGPKNKPKLKATDIQGAKYLSNITDLLKPLQSHCDCANRKLHYDEYIAFILLYFFTPVLTSMRGLQQASHFEHLHKKLKLGRFSLGSFSEAGSVFDPQMLDPIIEELGDKITAVQDNPLLASTDLAITAADGTLLHALPKMAWALWLDGENRAAKMHVEFEILKGIPTKVSITHGNGDERTVLAENLAPGHLYVLDRGYAEYGLMARIIQAQSSFVVRIRKNAVYEIIEERPISQAAERAGVQRDLIVKLGSTAAPELHDKQIRLIQIHKTDLNALLGRPRKKRVSSDKSKRTDKPDHTLLLASDELYLEADIVGEFYRSRWQVEIFFRWFKKILQADHPLSLCENGFTIVAYCAIIASLLVVLWTGRKPTKRTYEMICFYFLGWVTEHELIAHIEKLGPAAD